MEPMQGQSEGAFHATSYSHAVVCAAHRAVLVLQTESSTAGLDGFRCQLTGLSLDLVKTAHEMTAWPDSLQGYMAAETIETANDGKQMEDVESEPKQVKRTAGSKLQQQVKQGFVQHLALKAKMAQSGKEIPANWRQHVCMSFCS